MICSAGRPDAAAASATACCTAARSCVPVPGELTVRQAQALPAGRPGRSWARASPNSRSRTAASCSGVVVGEPGCEASPAVHSSTRDVRADAVQPGHQPAGAERFVVGVRGQDTNAMPASSAVVQRQFRERGQAAACPGVLAGPGDRGA